MTASQIEAEIERLRHLPYTFEVTAEDDGSWFARVVEFSGCITVGSTREEALRMLDDAMASWIEAKLEANEPVPQPIAAASYSGKFIVRVAKALHRDLARSADANGVSLNQFVSTVLAQAVGRVEGVSFLIKPRSE